MALGTIHIIEGLVITLLLWQVIMREVSFRICSNVKLVHMVYQFEFIPKVSSITQLNLIWLEIQSFRLYDGLSPSNCIGMDILMVDKTINVVRNFWPNQFLKVRLIRLIRLIMVKVIVELISKQILLIEDVLLILVKVIIYY